MLEKMRVRMRRRDSVKVYAAEILAHFGDHEAQRYLDRLDREHTL
jgi:hypothetical protein